MNKHDHFDLIKPFFWQVLFFTLGYKVSLPFVGEKLAFFCGFFVGPLLFILLMIIYIRFSRDESQKKKAVKYIKEAVVYLAIFSLIGFLCLYLYFRDFYPYR